MRAALSQMRFCPALRHCGLKERRFEIAVRTSQPVSVTAISNRRSLKLHTERHRSSPKTAALLQMIRFDERDAGRAAHAADDGGVIARRQIGEDRGFQIVRRGEAGGRDRRLL